MKIRQAAIVGAGAVGRGAVLGVLVHRLASSGEEMTPRSTA